jgi:hypothetical protein
MALLLLLRRRPPQLLLCWRQRRCRGARSLCTNEGHHQETQEYCNHP